MTVKNKPGIIFCAVTLFAVAAAIGFLLPVGSAAAGEASLGKIDFPTSGSPEAQAHFLRGVAALHSFWFEEALEEFQKATQVQPDFMMGYWGEAMAHNHPLWAEQDTEAARKVVQKIRDNEKLTAKERAYLGAVKALYGEGDKLTRDKAYSAAMEKMYRDHPDDLEVATFYALSLLGTVRPDDKGFRRQMQAGAIAMDVSAKNPNHPGAAHFIIHSFDDPEHAILALPAARRYAQIAPEAHHARHMPAHIFLQLGMWPDAAASNESAWSASDAWVKSKSLPLIRRDYHSLHWLTYVYLQQGRYAKADQLLNLMRKTMTESTDDSKFRPNYYANNFADMASIFVVETEKWNLAETIFQSANKASEPEAAGASGGHAGHGGNPTDATAAVTRRSNASQVLPVFVRGLAAARTSPAQAEKAIAELKSLMAKGSSADNASNRNAGVGEIRVLEVGALASAYNGDYAAAIEAMKKATALEESLSPPSGPPPLIKPSHELFGEILLRAGQPKEASRQFAVSLLRQPNRARSLLGAARAAAMADDRPAAAGAYSSFLANWKQADAGLPEIAEARNYVAQANRP
ncbi:MAG TPA: hypothetical protein VGK99_01465 [Acidobacteriota bacterium]|jgi:hypothetical protein